MNLRELSELLGLSQTTVSRALNGYPEVREETRLRIQAAAQEHNYHPNARATSLATGKTMAIGHVIPVSTQHEMVNVVFSDFIAGAGEVYSQAGFDMRLRVVSDDSEAEAYAQMARNGVVDGVIVHGPVPDDPRILLLNRLGLPFVVHGRSTGASVPHSWVDVNNRRAFERATRFLLELGHQRIALLNGLEHMDFAARRRAGFVTAMDSAGFVPDASIMFSDEMTEPFGYRATKASLEQRTPPSAVIASSIIVALGARRAIEERGLTLGKDVSLLCFDDQVGYLPNGGSDPIFTATRSSVRAAGRRCAELLIDQINGVATEPVQELWEAELVIGGSTGPAPTRAG